MGNSAVREADEMLADLVDKNPDAFKDMGEENMKEILERIAEEPEDAKEIMKELKKEQEQMSEEVKQEEEKPQLKQDRVMDAFQKAQGSPQKKEQVLGHLMCNILKDLSKSESFFGEVNAELKTKLAMKNT